MLYGDQHSGGAPACPRFPAPNSLAPVLRGEGRGEGSGANAECAIGSPPLFDQSASSIDPSAIPCAPLPNPLPGVPGRGSKRGTPCRVNPFCVALVPLGVALLLAPCGAFAQGYSPDEAA